MRQRLADYVADFFGCTQGLRMYSLLLVAAQCTSMMH